MDIFSAIDSSVGRSSWNKFLRSYATCTDARASFYTREELDTYLDPKVLTMADLARYEVFEKWLEELPEGIMLGYDLETRGTEPHDGGIVGLGLSDGTNHYYLGVTDDVERWREVNGDVPCFTQDFVAGVVEYLIIVKKAILLTYQGKYEWVWTKRVFGVMIPHEQLIDIMVLDYLLTNRTRKLAAVENEYLGRYPMGWKELVSKHCLQKSKDATYIDKDKTLWAADYIPFVHIAPYCCEDAYSVVLLYPLLYRQIINKNLTRVWQIDKNNVVSSAMMTENGVLIDMTYIEKSIKALDVTVEIMRDELCTVAGDKTFNPNSPAQVSKLLFDVVGIPTTGIPKTANGYSTASTVLTELEDSYDVVRLLLEYRKSHKLLTGFVPNVRDKRDKNGVLHCDWNTVNAVTGRWTSSNPNFQNLPNPAKYASLGDMEYAELGVALRRCFVARPGCVLIVADYPAFEFRILAHLSRDPLLLDIYLHAKDLHNEICCILFGLDHIDKNNPLHRQYRTVTKTINFGSVYGMGASKLQRQLRLYGIDWDTKQCEVFIETYWSKLPGVRAFFDGLIVKSMIYGYAETLMGRKRFFDYNHEGLRNLRAQYDVPCTQQTYKLLKEQGYLVYPSDLSNIRQCQNFPMQGSNADAIRSVVNTLSFIELSRHGYLRVLMQVHDELVIECHEKYADEVEALLKHTMENAISLCVPLPVEPIICTNWGSAK